MSPPDPWPLSGLRVVDLSTEISGPYCTKLLVDAGAEVIKVEAPGKGDPLRRWTASHRALPPDADGALFQYLNASKMSIALDRDDDADRRTLTDLCTRADLVIENFAPGEMDRLELGHEALTARNPVVSLISISAWGGTGPWATRPATEFTLQAATGSTAYRGLPDRKPVAAGGRIGEWIAGTFAAVGALSAWLSARHTGRGQWVDVSMFEAMILCLTIYHDLNGQWVEGALRRSVEIPSVEPAKDGWVGISTITGQQWIDFCSLIGQPEVAKDERYLDGRRRMEHIEIMHEIIHGWTRERSVDEIVEALSLMRIPVAPVGDGRTLPQTDHFRERGVYVENPAGFLQPRVPYQLENGTVRPFGSAPRLDEHAAEIRADLERTPAVVASAEGGSELPLAGLRVIDLTAFWAGPFATSYLADMGADVVKVESMQRPDGMRFAGAIPKESLWEWSPVFHGANSGKRDVTLQIDSSEGIALLKRLISEADVVIENYSVRVLGNFGLGWDAVQSLNPRTILLRMPAFGLDGPWRDRTGFAMTIEQASGMAWMTGYPDLPLVVRGACDPIGGMHSVFALLLALEDRKRTGVGQLVEVPLVEAALNVAAELVIEHSAYGELLSRDENRGPVAAPQGLYRCADPEEFVAIAIASDEQWRAFCSLLSDPDWSREPDLAGAVGRRRRHDELDAHIEAWLAQRSQADAVEALVEAGVPAQAAINAHFLMPNPQLEHRQFFQTMKHPVTGETRYPGFPMRFSAFGPRLHPSPPPTLGQHNEQILGEDLGLSREEIQRLKDAGVIGERPSFM